MILKIVLLVLSFVNVYRASELSERIEVYDIEQEKSICDPSVEQQYGYYSIPNTDKKYFFWFFESRNSPSTDPVVLWVRLKFF